MVFTITSKDGSARTGILKTFHGKVQTPFFMPVATKGAVKFVSHPELEELGIDCIISNAFINYLKPGLKIISKAKGLHKFMNWNKSLFTDSGGFQLILDDFVDHVTDKGVYFKNPFNKSTELISPEYAIQIQNKLGSDVAMCLDHQPKFGKTRKDYIDSLIRTIEWAQRCKKAHKNKNQLLFGITQGGTHKDLRVAGAIALEKIGFDGIAIGGFGIGEAQEKVIPIVKATKKVIDENRPVYCMGIGSPIELLNLIEQGVDMFDSSYPTRMARHGAVFTKNGIVNIKKGKYKSDFSVLDKSSNCFVGSYSKAYLHHLFKTYEQTGLMLLSYNNTHFISNLIKESRIAIKQKRFTKFKNEFEQYYK